MAETFGAVSSAVAAILTAVATIMALIRDRTGLHQLEKLCVAIDSMKDRSAQRRLLEDLRDELATDWGIKALARREMKTLSLVLYVLAISYIVISVLLFGYFYLSWDDLLDSLQWLGWAQIAVGAAMAVVYIVRLERREQWELRERVRRNLV